jgi:hypothetical protein
MNAKTIVESLKNHKGQNILACWTRPMKTRKDVPFTITKTTCAVIRAGIDYSNLSAVKNGIAQGTREEVGELPWGTWIQFPFIIGHNGNEYVRLYPSSNSGKNTTKTEYHMDGVPATAEQVKPYCLASEFRDKEENVLAFTVKAESLVSIG